MRILDIIQQTNEGVVDAFMRGLEKGAGKVATPAERATAAARAGEKLHPMGVVPKAAEKSGVWTKFEEWAAKSIQEEADKTVSAQAKATVLAHAEKKVGEALGWLNLAGWVAWYNFVAKPRLDKDYKEGRIKTAAEYQEKLTWLRGQLVTQIILPRVAIKVASSKTISWLPSRLPWMLEKVGAKDSAAMVKGVTALATTTAAYTLPPVFSQWLAETIGDIVFFPAGVAFNLTGSALEALSSALKPSKTDNTQHLQWAGPAADQAKKDIDATSNEPVFGKQQQGTKWADSLGASSFKEGSSA